MGLLSRRFAAVFVLFALLFSQLAVAAYACPMPMESQPMAGCDEMPSMDLPNVCERHCHDAQQVQSNAPMPPGFVPSFIAVLEPPALAAPRDEWRTPGLERPCFPPPSLRHCCLRI